MEHLSEESQRYWDDLSIIDCHGDKCRRSGRTHAWDGFGIHCTACHGDITEELYREVARSTYDGCDVYTFGCKGDKCRRSGKTHINDGYGLHCVDCHGELYSDSE